MNVCILFYPEDGDQAWVDLVDLNILSQSTDPDDIVLYGAIQAALKDLHLIAEIPFPDEPFGGPSVLRPPCQIDKCITIYLET